MLSVSQRPTKMELAATEIALQIVQAVNTIPGTTLWNFNEIKDFVSGIKDPDLKLMVWQDILLLARIFQLFQ